MKTTPHVSVIIPTHNRADLLQRAVNSVLAQSYQQFEVIIVDDGSTDDTATRCESIADPRFLVVRHEIAKGGASARNSGLHSAQGELIAFLDDDDEWMPDKLALQVDHMTTNPGACLGYTGYFYVDTQGRAFKEFTPRLKGNLYESLLAENVIGTTSTVIIRQECFARVGAFDEQLQSCQDWDLWIRIAKQYDIDFVASPLVKFLIHEKRITRNLGAKIQGRLRLLEKHGNEIKKDNALLGRHYLELGHLYCHNGSVTEGRRLLWQGMKLSPGSFSHYGPLASAMLGEKAYRKILSLKRKVRKPEFLGK